MPVWHWLTYTVSVGFFNANACVVHLNSFKLNIEDCFVSGKYIRFPGLSTEGLLARHLYSSLKLSWDQITL